MPPIRERLGRFLWAANVVVVLVIVVSGSLTRYDQLRTPCATEPRCFDVERLPPSGVERLARSGLSPQGYAVYLTVLANLGSACALGLNGLLLSRRTSSRASVLFAGLLAWMSVQVISSDAAYWGPAWLPAAINTIQTLSLILFFVLFPDGRFVPRWAVLIPVAMIALLIADATLGAQGVGFFSHPVIGTVLWITTLALLISAQVYRYARVSGPVQRQQSKAFVLALAMWPLLVLPLNLLAPQPGSPLALVERTINYVTLAGLVLAITYAVLRYRLWDIDVLIRRTLVYGVLSVLLAVVYYGSVLALESVLRPLTGQSQSQLVTVVSTLTIAGLFFPLRARVQGAIDRRFYRRKYDAARMLETFAATAREEVELETLAARLTAVVAETMQPASLGLWLKPAPPGRPKSDSRDAAASGWPSAKLP
jgi:hypothetical protein